MNIFLKTVLCIDGPAGTFRMMPLNHEAASDGTQHHINQTAHFKPDVSRYLEKNKQQFLPDQNCLCHKTNDNSKLIMKNPK